MRTKTVSIWGLVFTLLLVWAASAQGVQQSDVGAGISSSFRHPGSAASSPGEVTAQQQARNVEFVGRFGSVTTAVALYGSYAYLGVGPYIVILDVSNPANPVVIGRTEPLPAVVNNLTVRDGYAYVADRDGGLRIVAVSDPAHPVEVGFYNPGVLIWDVAIAGNYAYTVTKGDDRLRIIDISDPAHPVEVGFLALPHCAWSVVVKEGYAYVANYGWGLRIINVSDPANPVEVGSYRDPREQIVDVAVAGDYAYIAEIGGRLDIRYYQYLRPRQPC